MHGSVLKWTRTNGLDIMRGFTGSMRTKNQTIRDLESPRFTYKTSRFLDPPSISPLAKALVTLIGQETGSPRSLSGPGTEEECPGSARSRV
jgi:hypothetical protein